MRFDQKMRSKPFLMFTSARAKEASLHKRGGHKIMFFRCPLIGTCLPTIGIYRRNFNKKIINLKWYLV